MILEMESDTEFKYKKKEFDEKISWKWPIYVIVFYCFLYYYVYYNDSVLPDTVTLSDIEHNPLQFSGENSKIYLQKLTALGARTFGSEAEMKGAELIINEVKEIMKSSHASQSILIERQFGSGSYQLGKKTSYTNIYHNIQNVIVMIKGSNTEHSIMMNGHFDTVPEVEGAGDDGIACAVMLELIRAFSKSTKKFTHNIIFLFNGAEEISLQGSHLFLQHKWSKSIKAFINMDAAGSGGKEMLFQTVPGHSWVFDYYAKTAPRPYGFVLFEELFQAGVMPSDTDFRIFRDFGDMAGVDLAFSKNGYVYHTKSDAEYKIPANTHQHIGDNVYAMAKALADAPEINIPDYNTNTTVIFYDFLGLYFFNYSSTTSICLALIAILLSIISIVIFFLTGVKKSDSLNYTITSKPLLENVSESRTEAGLKKSAVFEMIIIVLIRIFAIITAAYATVAVAQFINSTAPMKMPWFSNTYLIFPLYWCPLMVVYSMIPVSVEYFRSNKHLLSTVTIVKMHITASQILYMMILFYMICNGIKSSFVLCWPVMTFGIFNLIINIINIRRETPRWIWYYFLINIPSTLLSFYIIVISYYTLIPTYGRSGVINADFKIAVFTSIFGIFLLSIYEPFMHLVKKPQIVYGILTSFFIFTLIVALTTRLGQPYKSGIEAAPQKYWIMHTSRTFYTFDNKLRRNESGYFVLNQDPNSPSTIPARYKINMTSLKEDCETEFYCGLPLFKAGMFGKSPQSHWIPAEPPIVPNPLSITLKNSKSNDRDCDLPNFICKFVFRLKGPDRLTFTFAPIAGASLIKWSLPSEPAYSQILNGKTMYFLHIITRNVTEPFNITLYFEVSPEQLQGEPIVEVGLAGNHAHHQESRTQSFKTFLDSLPEWTDKTGYISPYEYRMF